MKFNKKAIEKIRKTLPANYRQAIAEKCCNGGIKITVRQVSLVIANQTTNPDLVLPVAKAIKLLIEDQEQKAREAENLINSL